MTSSKDKIRKLEEKILFHKRKYYKGEPIISDDEYDALEAKLRSLDPANPVLFIVGTPEGGKVVHDPPMLSCQKATSVEDVLKWAKGKHLYAGYKVDGLSLSISYADGKFIQAATRGNGQAGDDVTLSIMKIISIPKLIPHDEVVNVRGELFMQLSEFNRINSSLGEDDRYSSPRNLAVGTLKHKDPVMLETRELKFSAWDVLGLDPGTSTKERTEIVRSWGFETADFKYIPDPNREVITKFFNEIEAERDKSLDFEIDGLLFKYNDSADRETAGTTEHHPKWQIALKFASKGGITEISGITWQLGRTGVLTPVAELKPVEVAGALISRATLHNADFLIAMKIAKGDSISVIRSGDVIPKIVKVIEKGSNSVRLPMKCPSCGEPVHKDGVNLVCTASICTERDIQRILQWIRITDIKGLGIKNVQKLYEANLVRHYADLYSAELTENKLVQLLGINGKKIKKKIEETRKLPFHLFLAGLGIESLGKRMGKVLAKEFSSFIELQQSSLEQLCRLEGISDLTAGYIIQGVRDPSLAQRLLDNDVKILYEPIEQRKKPSTATKPTLGQFLDDKKAMSRYIQGLPKEIFLGDKKEELDPSRQSSKEHSSKGIRVYLTGKVEGMTKKEVQTFVEKRGYEWSKSISGKLGMLIVGEKPGQSKVEKAEEKKVKVITWEEFLRLV